MQPKQEVSKQSITAVSHRQIHGILFQEQTRASPPFQRAGQIHHGLVESALQFSSRAYQSRPSERKKTNAGVARGYSDLFLKCKHVMEHNNSSPSALSSLQERLRYEYSRCRTHVRHVPVFRSPHQIQTQFTRLIPSLSPTFTHPASHPIAPEKKTDQE